MLIVSQQDNRVNSSGGCCCFVGQTEVWEVRGEESVSVCWLERCCRSGRSQQGRNVNRADLSLLISLYLSVGGNLLPTAAFLFAEAHARS